MRIKEILKEKGITNKELATKLGVTSGAISQYISENGNPNLKTLERIATALNVPIQELFNPPTENKITLTCPHCNGVVNVSLSVQGEQKEETRKE